MTKIIMKLLPYSKEISYCSTYNSLSNWIKIGFYNSKIAVLLNNKSNLLLNTCMPVLYGFSRCLHIDPSQQNNGFGESIGEPEDMVYQLTRNIEIDDHSEHFRSSLFPFTSDTVIEQLKSCDSVKQLLEIVNENLSLLTSEHYCQIILVLWHLHTKIYFTGVCPEYNKSIAFRTLNIGGENNNCISSLVLKALRSVSTDLDRLSPEALVCAVLYSNRLGINLEHPFIQTVLLRINYLLLNENINGFSIYALSRLTLALGYKDELWTKIFLINTIPLIYTYLGSCCSYAEFRALTISMLPTLPYLREDFLLQYEALTEEMLRTGIITRDNTSVITKAALLLSHICHKPTARFMVFRLLQMLEGNINNLFTPHVFDLNRIVWRHAEPHYTITELERLKASFSAELTSLPTALFPFHPFFSVPPDSRGSLIIKDIISINNRLDSLLFIQMYLTTAHPEACQMFWSKVAKLMTTADKPTSQMLENVCLRFIHFSNQMGSYRHRHFEADMLSLITTELVEGTARHQPRVFAVLAAFVLAFDHRHLYGNIAPRLLSMMGQFNAMDCLRLSKGLMLGLKYQRNKDLQIYLQLDSALNDRTKEILETSSGMSISTLNMILRSCINRRGFLEGHLFWDALKRSESLDWSQFTSKDLKNLVYNLTITNALVPTAVDRMVEYCLQNRLYVTGDTVGKLAYTCYKLGYLPAEVTGFCQITADLCTRDREMLNGLTVLHAALALSFLNQLPSSLIRFIFTVQFLERLDNEIKNCYSKMKYPVKVRLALMELNRSVCLDQPEADIPWFHAKFCEEQQALGQLERRPKSLLMTDVLNTLVSVVGDQSCISTQAYTPYGYSIDIQLNLDAALRPVPASHSEHVVHKLALLLHYRNSYTVYEQRLKGYQQMKKRHLEILGYKVIEISDSLWNSMFMTEPKAKQEYLKKLIWPS